MGGFFAGLGAFAIFAGTMGVFVFLLSFLGSTSGGPTPALRTWGRRMQSISGLVIILVGGALIYAGIDPGVYGNLILSK